MKTIYQFTYINSNGDIIREMRHAILDQNFDAFFARFHSRMQKILGAFDIPDDISIGCNDVKLEGDDSGNIKTVYVGTICIKECK